ncbi:MAG: TerB N-terminal domain-containing protein [Verrucomicrobiae bacterium]|nr:TerB N-terminal domain-containing protein [Verrucomicrobiae bacterium]
MFATILAAVLWYFGDFVAALAGFTFGWILGFVIRFFMRREREQNDRKRRSKRSANERTERQPSAQRSATRRERQLVRPPKKADPLQWFGPSEKIKVHGYSIERPMLYSSNGRLPWPGEPSAIDPSLPVARPARGEAARLGYYSSFEYLTLGQRGAYLEWLAEGRRDDDPAERDLGYVFLFFYGLERRILLVRDPDPRLRQEIVELLEHYGPSARSRSLRTYFLELLHFSSYLEGTEVYREVWPKWLTAHGAKLDGEVVKLVLANLFERGEPMHWTVAWHLAPRLEKSRKSVVVTRSGEKFWKLFEQRFEEALPGGMTLQAAKRPVWVEYRAASSSLLALVSDLNRDLRIRIPNVMGLHSQFNKLADIWNGCIDDLSGSIPVVEQFGGIQGKDRRAIRGGLSIA